MAKLNFNSINRKLTGAAKSWKEMEKAARIRINAAKEEMLESFDNHPVTEELKDGPNAQNLSGTLQYGNLFSFIGFFDGDDPTEAVREVLKRINYTKLKSYNQGNDISSYHFQVNVPARAELESITPYPDKWHEGSWLYGIERNIAGFPYYLFDDDGFVNSRSGSGIQIKNRVRSGGFHPTKYITEILNVLRSQLRQS